MSNSDSKQNFDPTPRPGESYFDPDGRMVLTEKYLLRRGNCCGNGCRHCPYEYCAVRDSTLRETLIRARREHIEES